MNVDTNQDKQPFYAVIGPVFARDILDTIATFYTSHGPNWEVVSVFPVSIVNKGTNTTVDTNYPPRYEESMQVSIILRQTKIDEVAEQESPEEAIGPITRLVKCEFLLHRGLHKLTTFCKNPQSDDSYVHPDFATVKENTAEYAQMIDIVQKVRRHLHTSNIELFNELWRVIEYLEDSVRVSTLKKEYEATTPTNVVQKVGVDDNPKKILYLSQIECEVLKYFADAFREETVTCRLFRELTFADQEKANAACRLLGYIEGGKWGIEGVYYKPEPDSSKPSSEFWNALGTGNTVPRNRRLQDITIGFGCGGIARVSIGLGLSRILCTKCPRGGGHSYDISWASTEHDRYRLIINKTVTVS